MNKNFATLKRDFDSCQLPSPYDPFTVKTLCKIVDSIRSGETTINEFDDYLAKEHMGRTPISQRESMYFGDACYSFVSAVLTYLEAKTR